VPWPAPSPSARTDLTLLWYNVFSRTRVDHARIAQALIDSPADIILLSEATPLQDQTETLFAAFPYHLGCEAKHCNFLVLSRIALTHPTLRLIEAQPPDRLAATQLELAGHEPLSVMGIHMVKPWYYGPTEHDRWYAQDTLRKIAGPLVVVGDFNAAPWSRRLKEFFRKFGLAPMPFPVPTWPAKAGRFGVPIDHVLVSGGARLVSITPWGAGLGSNHRGLLVGISVPAKADAGTP
jgi:endonuclease/exonuclease/phosphatase (EEP) superfamily protein YafD